MSKSNMRKAYGDTLLELGRENNKIVALEADLGKSTMSHFFGEEFPERYFQMGIAEADMISAAAGLALTGYIPFASTFAVFATGRPYDQIRSSVCIPNLGVKICGSSAGLSDFGDGKTHQSVDDIAIMRALPHMTVFSPADGIEAAKMVRAMAGIPGPCYIRVNRNELENVTSEEDIFEPGKIRSMREGTDLVIYATGYMVHQSLEAARLLERDGISAKVVNVATIKPLDEDGIIAAAKGMKLAVTVEEASVIGGLGSAVCETLAKPGSDVHIPVARIGLEDCFGQSAAGYKDLLEAYHLTPENIADRVKESGAV